MTAMKTSAFTILLLLLVVLFSSCMAQRPITHLQLVQTWTPTFCTTPGIRCVPLLGAKFAMHGLWPAGSAGTSVTNCGTSTVPETVFSQLQGDLRRTWPAIVLDRPERSHWNHEWRAHGTCTSMTALSYFQAAIRLKDGIDLLALLRTASITPTMDRTYTRTNIIAAVQARVGTNTNVYVSCREVNSTHVWLREIFVCFNIAGTHYFSCPASSDTRGCGGQVKQNNIIFPTTQTLMSSTDMHYENEGESFMAEGLEGEI